MKKIIQIILIYLLFVPFIISAQKNSTLSKRTLNSIELTLQATKIINSIGYTVWPNWNVENQTFFIGEKDNNCIFINPQFIIPKDFKLLESTSNIYYSKKCILETELIGTILKIDNNYYKAVSLTMFPSKKQHYYINRINQFTKTDKEKNDVISFFNSKEYYMSVIVHEAFHFYQKKHKKLYRYRTKKPHYYNKKKVQILSYIEGDLLRKALSMKKREDVKSFVVQFLAVRDEKSKFISKKNAYFEKVDEYIEGTAQYTQSFIMSKQMNSKQQKNNTKYINYFNYTDSLNFIASMIDIKSPGHKHYFYGEAQVKILDKLCNGKWRNELFENNNTFLIELLTKYSSYNENQQSELYKGVLKNYNFKIIKDKLIKRHHNNAYKK